MKRGEHNNRIYDKRHSCLYCGSEYPKIARHLQSVHKNEPEVLKIAAIDTRSAGGSKQKQLLLDQLRFRGDFYHNMEVLKVGGELKVWRRPSPDEKVHHEQFKACTFCLAFVQKHELWRHAASCPMNNNKGKEKDENSQNRKLQHQSDLLMFSSSGRKTSTDKEFCDDILSKMISDSVSLVVKTDHLITAYGSFLYTSKGKSKASLISQKMRLMARFLLEMQKLPAYASVKLSDCLRPEAFDDIIMAVRKLGEFGKDSSTDELPRFKTPSVALKLGYAIKQCAQLQQGFALRQRDAEMLESLNYFLKLVDSEWVAQISSVALRSLDDKKFDKPDVSPVASDLLILREYLLSTMKSSLQELQADPNLETWRTLAEATAARLLIFNKRRSNEATKVSIQQYLDRPQWDDAAIQEVQNSLQPLEKELCKRYLLLFI